MPAKGRPVSSTWWAKGPNLCDCVPLPMRGWRTVPEVGPALYLAPNSVPFRGASSV